MNKLNLGVRMKEIYSKYGKNIIIAIFCLFFGVDQGVDIYNKVSPENVSVIEAGEIAIAEAIRPVIRDVVQEEVGGITADIELIKSDIKALKDFNEKQITNNAISAYSKILTIEDLENSPLKKVSITEGLLLPSCYDILYTMDMERTKLFYDYLIEDSH